MNSLLKTDYSKVIMILYSVKYNNGTGFQYIRGTDYLLSIPFTDMEIGDKVSPNSVQLNIISDLLNPLAAVEVGIRSLMYKDKQLIRLGNLINLV